MKHIVTALALVLSSAVVLASQQATENWVKDYVSKHGGGGSVSSSSILAPTVVTVYDDNGSPATVTFNWCQNTNAAFRVYDSNVSGMSNGLYFAKVGDMRYYNATNSACNSITGQVEQTGMLFSKAVNRVIGNVTNTVYTVTNKVYDQVFYATVGGSLFRSTKVASNIHLFRPVTTNLDSRMFRVIESSISDITRNRIVTNPSISRVRKRTFRFLDLLFPSAYAGYEEPGVLARTEMDPPNPAINQEYIVYGYYQKHYFTEEDVTYSLGTIEWVLKNGEKATYTIDLLLPFFITGGTDAHTINQYETSTYTADSLKEDLAEYLPQGRYIQLTRSDSAWNAITVRLSELKEKYEGDIGKIKSMECPKEDKKELYRGKNECVNHVWKGTCGSWHCELCGMTDDTPSEHDYSQSGSGCDVCFAKHEGNSSVCGFRPSGIEHHFGWHDYESGTGDGYSHKCACECYIEGVRGYAIAHLDPGTADGYFQGSDGGCYRNWTCGRCGGQIGHGALPSNVRGITVSASAHIQGSDASFEEFVTNGVSMCKGSFTCDHTVDPVMPAEGCNRHIEELMDHIEETDESTWEIHSIPGDSVNHLITKPCVRKSLGCNYTFNITNEHDYAFYMTPGRVGDPIKAPDRDYHYSYRVCNSTDAEPGNLRYCGYVHITSSNRHDWALTDYGNPHGEYHDVSNRCSVCNYTKKLKNERHVARGMDYYYVNDIVHVVSSKCARANCEVDFFVKRENHDLTGILSYVHTNLAQNVSYHIVYDQCSKASGCGALIFKDIVRCDSSGDSSHSRKTISLVNDKDEMDYYPCAFCDGGVARYERHKFHREKDKHYCSQRLYDDVSCETEVRHLEGPHVYVTNVCDVCGYIRPYSPTNDTYETKISIMTETVHQREPSVCGSTRVTYERLDSTNGVAIAEKDRGDWTEIGRSPETMCYYNNGTGLCECPYCRGAETDVGECFCKRMRDGRMIKITMSEIVESYFRHYATNPAVIVDMFDPVYKVGDGCFNEAFISMPNLMMVKCGATTNVGNSAFERAFTNCTKLSSVDFGALEYAGNYAFSEAFVGCPLDSGVNVKTLLTCGIHGFLGAFKGSRISSLSFDSLVDPNGSLNIFEGTPCVTMRTLSAPKLNYNAFDPVFNFADMPNLQTLNLSGASSNVVSHIGDMSGLSKLTRIDLHEMTEIPSYSQNGASTGVHAPTNNPNCMIVVSDELWPAWCNAPGWIDIENQIVPYSNQVIRPLSWCTVAFDTDGANELENVRVKYGKSIVAPTNIFKWGEAEYTVETTDGAFTLEGWYTNAERTVRYTGWPVTTNTTLYAKWNDNRRIDCMFGLYSSYYGSDYYTVDGHSDIEFYNTRLGLGEIVPCRMRFLSSNQTGSWMYYSLNFYIDEYGRQNGSGFIPSFCGLFSENGIDVDIDYPDRMEFTVECPDGSYFYTTNSVSVRFD